MRLIRECDSRLAGLNVFYLPNWDWVPLYLHTLFVTICQLYSLGLGRPEWRIAQWSYTGKHQFHLWNSWYLISSVHILVRLSLILSFPGQHLTFSIFYKATDIQVFSSLFFNPEPHRARHTSLHVFQAQITCRGCQTLCPQRNTRLTT